MGLEVKFKGDGGVLNTNGSNPASINMGWNLVSLGEISGGKNFCLLDARFYPSIIVENYGDAKDEYNHAH